MITHLSTVMQFHNIFEEDRKFTNIASRRVSSQSMQILPGTQLRLLPVLSAANLDFNKGR